MTDIENAIEAITQQQSKLQKNSAPFFVGEQLKDILRGDAFGGRDCITGP